MADTAIEWASKVWNPVVGCSLQSPGCTNCYAMRMAWRLQAMAPKADGTGNYGLTHYEGTVQESRGGPVWTGKVNVAPDNVFLAPLRRKKPTDYFVNSMSDLFHPAVPFEVVDRVFAVMALSPQHIFKVLTKRSDQMRAYLGDPATPVRVAAQIIVLAMRPDLPKLNILPALAPRAREEDPEIAVWPLPNVWAGVSVEDQRRADERIPDLLAAPAAVRWISAEPLLGPVRLDHVKMFDHETPEGGREAGWESALNGKRFDPWSDGETDGWPKIDWVIVGGESGPSARPMHPAWARSLRDQCASAGVQFLFKQWGEYASVSEVEGPGKHHQFPDGATVRKVGKKLAGRLLDGVEHNGMPEVRHG
ncbi:MULTISPECIES: phage Gp37/Gp68 family protein [unclassified Novosphingobium]|uniref:phage Gp37/Gp68 family protein n=1 Tax=unclassified Novosphingobium TaxID=2644732 RepID=UPI000D308320|nr:MULTISPECIES: phage Gp37/Gp68 family protein [unclassified Novosphingobium]PTR05380.1 protein gp37 [Novosphingobium sp. GV055]PUA93944.1 protein gp37 [Novosphingobium sp. GV061]PUB11361.1 protein gp37 [Novosphingobium sp. GV079]PUB37051.1 protein gp37 [Novosphingobium sp. GV027]